MPGSLGELAEDLAAYDLENLAAGIGGLQLVPLNAERQLRFDLLASILPSLPLGRRLTSPARWRRLLHESPIGGEAVRLGEDPAEQPFTSSLSFVGGAAVVFNGIALGSVEVCRLLIEAVFRQAEMPGRYENEMRALTYAVLRLSDAIAKRAGLERNMLPQSVPGGQVEIPPAARFAQLKQAVTFGAEDLAAIFAPVTADVLSPLTVDAGSQALPQVWQPGDARGYATPILRVGGRLVVVLPSALLVALRHRLVARALAAGIGDGLARSFRLAVAREVANSLRMMDFRLLAARPENEPPWASEMVCAFDVDKMTHVLVISDDLSAYDRKEVFGSWRPSWQDEVEPRLLWVRGWARRQQPSPEGILQIVVVQGIGRFSAFSLTDRIDDPHAHVLLTSEADLAVIARKEAGDCLALWKFARARSRLHGRTEIVPLAGALGEYALYAANQHSFYLSDETAPNWVNISPDVGAKLRFEDARKLDVHGTASWGRTGIVEVWRLYAGSDVPIYLRTPAAVVHPELLVEGLALPLWVFPSTAPSPAWRPLIFELCEAVAYWLCQVSPSIAEAVGLAAQHVEQLGIEIVVEPSKSWSRFDRDAPLGRWVEATDMEGGLVRLWLGGDVAAAFLGPENQGERHLLTVLLGALGQAIVRLVQKSVSWDIGAMVERHAPLGPKKKVISLLVAPNLELSPGTLPAARFVHGADLAEVMDDMGPRVASVLGLATGPIPPERRVPVLNEMVTMLFAQLEADIATLSSEELLECLMAQHESLVHESALDRLSIPTRLACFGSEASYLERMAAKSRRITEASPANRFLIEYVAARPPRGSRTLRLDAFDHLMAFAAEIIARGMTSDAIRYGQADTKLSILPSGRLGMGREGRYVVGVEDFRRYREQGEVEAAKAWFARHWRVPLDSRPEPVTDLDKAVRAELGFSMTELVELTAEAISLAQDLGDPAVMDLAAATRGLGAALKVEPEQVKAMLAQLALSPRDAFLPAGRAFEAYPWRFSRELSYLRRPFVIRVATGREELLWGVRHLSGWWQNMLHVILNGRLKARSAAMQQFMTEIKSEEAEAFNDRIADLFAARTELVVRRRVKKVGKLRIQEADGQALGDIDVLVVNPRRRRILAVETKDFELARTPAELGNEVQKLLAPEGSAAARHARRLQWLREHLPQVCEWLQLDRGKKAWKIEALIVVSRRLMSPYIHTSRIEVVAFEDLDIEALL